MLGVIVYMYLFARTPCMDMFLFSFQVCGLAFTCRCVFLQIIPYHMQLGAHVFGGPVKQVLLQGILAVDCW